MSSFYACRSQKCKKLLDLTVFFALLGPAHLKAVHKKLVKLTQGGGRGGRTAIFCHLSRRAPILSSSHFLTKMCNLIEALSLSLPLTLSIYLALFLSLNLSLSLSFSLTHSLSLSLSLSCPINTLRH